MWRTPPGVLRRHSCRRPGTRKTMSIRISTRHAWTRALQGLGFFRNRRLFEELFQLLRLPLCFAQRRDIKKTDLKLNLGEGAHVGSIGGLSPNLYYQSCQ